MSSFRIWRRSRCLVAIVVVSARFWFSRRDRICLGEISPVSVPLKISPRISPRWKTQPQSRPDLAEVFRSLKISPRSRLPRRDLASLGEINAISARFCPLKITPRITEISPRSQLPRRDLAYLGEINAISARSRRNFFTLKFSPRITEISPRSRSTRRDLANLGEITEISARSR